MSEPVRLYLTKWALHRHGPIQGVIILDVSLDQIAAWKRLTAGGPMLVVPREALEPWTGPSVVRSESFYEDQWFTEEGAARYAVKKMAERAVRAYRRAHEEANEQLADFRRQGVRYAETKAVRNARRKQERAQKVVR